MTDEIKSVTLAWFSGTGGSAMAADWIEKKLIARGKTVQKIEITNERRQSPIHTDLLVVLAPVYAFRLAVIAEKWVKSLPAGNGMSAALIAVSGGGEISPNTACRAYSKRVLSKKGYSVVYETMLIMPANFAAETPEALAARLISVLPEKADKIVSDLLTGKSQLIQPKTKDRFFTVIGKCEHFGSRCIGRFFHATEECTKCGLCVKKCPQNNISLKNGKIKYGFNCILCMKCIYACPKQALKPGIFKFVVLKNGFDIHQYEKKAPDPADDVGKLGPLFGGMADYFAPTAPETKRD